MFVDVIRTKLLYPHFPVFQKAGIKSPLETPKDYLRLCNVQCMNTRSLKSQNIRKAALPISKASIPILANRSHTTQRTFHPCYSEIIMFKTSQDQQNV